MSLQVTIAKIFPAGQPRAGFDAPGAGRICQAEPIMDIISVTGSSKIAAAVPGAAGKMIKAAPVSRT
jgi:hypothetical protein